VLMPLEVGPWEELLGHILRWDGRFHGEVRGLLNWRFLCGLFLYLGSVDCSCTWALWTVHVPGLCGLFMYLGSVQTACPCCALRSSSTLPTPTHFHTSCSGHRKSAATPASAAGLGQGSAFGGAKETDSAPGRILFAAEAKDWAPPCALHASYAFEMEGCNDSVTLICDIPLETEVYCRQ